MRISYKTRQNISQVLSIVLLCALGLTAIFGVSALSNKLEEETKVIHPTFEVGGLASNGKYEDTDASVYTKEAFACDGLQIKLDFDSTVKYQVFYYNELGDFESSTEVYEKSMRLKPEEGLYARIVVTPVWSSEVAAEDRVCHWYDVAKYSSQLEITVNKVQEEAGVPSEAVFDIGGVDLATLSPLSSGAGVCMYKNNTKLLGQTITKIGVPVASVTDYTKDNTFTVFVINENGTKSTIAEEIKLTIPANTFNSNTVNDWYYFDVNVSLNNNQTIGIHGNNDTVTVLYSQTNLDEFGFIYNKVGAADCAELGFSIILDVWVEKY